MDGNISYWKSRALKAEEHINIIKFDLEKEKQKRVEFEMMITERFELFCREYEERLLVEIGQSKKSAPNGIPGSRRDAPIPFERNLATPLNDTKNDARRSYTPTPRRAPPVPPGRKSQN
jgi:hypothetical protein